LTVASVRKASLLIDDLVCRRDRRVSGGLMPQRGRIDHKRWRTNHAGISRARPAAKKAACDDFDMK
jgi:hypothetical protein